jgi:ABC-type nickel/cobalt efflux system permease component RcnA
VPSIFRSTDPSPFVLLAALVTAAAIGAGHALTPGHGKTLMAAYLVGSRGTALHAVGLGLSVAVSHTLGILVLAVVVLGAGSVLPADMVYRVTPAIAAVSIVAIGTWMLSGEIRTRATPAARRRRDDPLRVVAGTAPGIAPADIRGGAAEHSHRGVRHGHVAPADGRVSRRGLFVLGLAGGLIPSASALIILLGAIAAGRPVFGVILVIAFGLGMAAVMIGVGFALTLARGRLERIATDSALGRLARLGPLLGSIAVLGFGIVLTVEALGRPPAL